MKFHKQRNRHDPDNGLYGDCARTCFACILDMELDDVPHFHDGAAPEDVWTKAVDEFLEPLGLELFTVPYPGDQSLNDILTSIGHYNPRLLYILTGQGAAGVNHCVVCQGKKIIHDPSPTFSGIVGPAQPDGFYWIELLARRNSFAAEKEPRLYPARRTGKGEGA